MGEQESHPEEKPGGTKPRQVTRSPPAPGALTARRGDTRGLFLRASVAVRAGLGRSAVQGPEAPGASLQARAMHLDAQHRPIQPAVRP